MYIVVDNVFGKDCIKYYHISDSYGRINCTNDLIKAKQLVEQERQFGRSARILVVSELKEGQ